MSAGTCTPERITSVSAHSSRGRQPAISRPSGHSVGKSFALWTAMSASPARSASSISFVKSPFPPNFSSDQSCRLSPDVFISTISNSAPEMRAPRYSAAIRACTSAKGLERVASLIFFMQKTRRKAEKSALQKAPRRRRRGTSKTKKKTRPTIRPSPLFKMNSYFLPFLAGAFAALALGASTTAE